MTYDIVHDDAENMTIVILGEEPTMPMIDVTAAAGTFGDRPGLIRELTAAMLRWEEVPDLALFRDNTAAFVHELPTDALGNATGDHDYVRIQILTPAGVLDRDKQLGVTREMTDIVAEAAGDPTLAERTWVLITESPDGGWGIDGRALTGADIAEAARRELAGGA
jgi:phenylpyruvate tautomerase PptA (4-oxalocrotonate tautomerase family)